MWFVAICLNLSLGTAKENNASQVRYQMMFKTNYIQCVVRINDVFIYDTYDSVGSDNPIQLSFGQGVTEFLNRGKNTLSVEVSNMAEYIPAREIPNAYCEVTIMASVDNPQTGSVDNKVVSNIRYTYVPRPEESDSIFPYLMSIKESNYELDNNLASPNIVLKELDYTYDADKEPVQNMIATRSFTVNHPQPFSWVNRSTPFEDTPANRQKLWDKYNEIRNAIERKDKKAIRKLVEPGVSDMAAYYGDTVNNHFEDSFSLIFDSFFNLNRKLYFPDQGELSDYDLEIYNDCKLFRLNQKGYTLISLLQWENFVSGVTRRYNPIFTYIDGNILILKHLRVAIFLTSIILMKSAC